MRVMDISQGSYYWPSTSIAGAKYLYLYVEKKTPLPINGMFELVVQGFNGQYWCPRTYTTRDSTVIGAIGNVFSAAEVLALPATQRFSAINGVASPATWSPPHPPRSVSITAKDVVVGQFYIADYTIYPKALTYVWDIRNITPPSGLQLVDIDLLTCSDRDTCQVGDWQVCTVRMDLDDTYCLLFDEFYAASGIHVYQVGKVMSSFAASSPPKAAAAVNVPPKMRVCECGVGKVGGIHSSWCPVYGREP